LDEKMNVKIGIMVSVLIATHVYAGDISALSPQEMATIVNYDYPVTLGLKESGPVSSHEWGNLLHFWSYSSKTQTLHSYHIAVFAGGTLFGTNRVAMENRIQEAEIRFAAGPDKYFSVVTMPDGHKVYYSGLAFGPGGALMGGFATLPNGLYDLLVAQAVDFEDDMPQEQKLINPAKPQSTLQEIYPKVEAFILKQLRNNERSQSDVEPDIEQDTPSENVGVTP
jgi:hypothetical protein